MSERGERILDVDLLAFERGSTQQRRAVVDGVRRSLETGFVYTHHDLSVDLLDTAYGMLREFFGASTEDKQRFVAPGANGQTGYTGLLVETAASSDTPDWKEMLNWSTPIPSGHPLKRAFATAYPDQVLPEALVPGITKVLYEFHDTIADLQRRFLRVIAEGIGCHETFFDDMVHDGPTLTRAIRYPPMSQAPLVDASVAIARSGTAASPDASPAASGGGDGRGSVAIARSGTAASPDASPAASRYEWAGAHGDINLITALPRATAPGLQVMVDGEWVDAVAPEGQAIINTGIMLERLTNGRIPIGWHRVVSVPGYDGERYSVVQFCHPRPWTVLHPVPSCIDAEHPQRFSAITAADALAEVLYEINLVEDARRVGGDDSIVNQ